MARPVPAIDYTNIDAVHRTALNVAKRCPEARGMSLETLESIADTVVARDFHAGRLASYRAIVAAVHAEVG